MESSKLLPISAHPKKLWDAVLGEIQLQVTRPCYETWFKNTSGAGRENGSLLVDTPNAFVAEMLEKRMSSIICQATERVAQEHLDVRFQVLGGPKDLLQSEGSASEKPPSSSRLTEMEVSSDHNNHVSLNSGDGHNGHNHTALQARSPSNSRHTILNPSYTFNNFIVGKSNELAHAAAVAVAERPGHIYNPLFIYAGVGLGKTHLLHAIGHALTAKGLTPMYSTTEEFTNEYVSAIREGRTEEFRSRYRSANALLLDDIQFLIGKEQTQEGFFHTFNALHMANRQVVVTSDRPVSALALLEDRVQSRLVGGLVADIHAPDLETRMAILRAKADSMRRSFSSQVLEFLAERIHRNIRELEGSLNRLTAYADLVGVDIDLDVARKVVADSLHSSNRRRPAEGAVIDAVASYFHIDKDTLLGRRRDKHTALARQVAMYLLREEAQSGLSQVGRAIGGKDHSTVIHACKKISGQIKVDSHLRQDILNIRESLQT